MKVETTAIPGVRVCTPDLFPDARGFFTETYQQARYDAAGIPGPFVQDNYSHSSRGVLRGLHFQVEHAQAKLLYVPHGEIYDVIVDVRRGSPTFGRWEGFVLSEGNRQQLYVPVGLAHGFCVLSAKVDVMYKCSELYHPAGERGLLWSDPDIGITWPIQQPLLSDRDARHARLRDIPEKELPWFEGRGEDVS